LLLATAFNLYGTVTPARCLPRERKKMHPRTLVFALAFLTLSQAQEPLEVNWTWFFETSTLLYFGAFEIAEGQLRPNAPEVDYAANITELDTRSADVVVLLNALNIRQQQYTDVQRQVPRDLVYLITSTRALYVGIGALRNFYAQRQVDLEALNRETVDPQTGLELLYLAESSYNTHQLAYALFSEQAVEGIQR
jgi:hypothetical protein